MKTFVDVYYWIKIVVLAVAVLLALLAAARLSRRRPYSAVREVVLGIVALGAFAALTYVTSSAYSIYWAAGLAILGIVFGYWSGRASRFSQDEGKTTIRRSPVGPWLWALTAILLTMTLFFGTSYLFALAMLVLAFATGTVVGQLAKELGATKQEAAEIVPPVVVTAEVEAEADAVAEPETVAVAPVAEAAEPEPVAEAAAVEPPPIPAEVEPVVEEASPEPTAEAVEPPPLPEPVAEAADPVVAEPVTEAAEPTDPGA